MSRRRERLPCEACGAPTDRLQRSPERVTPTGGRYRWPIHCDDAASSAAAVAGKPIGCRAALVMECPRHPGCIGYRVAFEVGGGCVYCEHPGREQPQPRWAECIGGCKTRLPRELEGSEAHDYHELPLDGLWCRACAEVERACRRMGVQSVAQLAGLRSVAESFVARISDVLRRSGVDDAERLIVVAEALAARARESDVFARYEGGA